VLVVAFVVGRWWAIPLAAAGWTVLLLATDTIALTPADLAGAVGLAALNAVVGVAANRVLLWPLRELLARRQSGSTP